MRLCLVKIAVLLIPLGCLPPPRHVPAAAPGEVVEGAPREPSSGVRALTYASDGRLAVLIQSPQGCELRVIAAPAAESTAPIGVPSAIACERARVLFSGAHPIVSDDIRSFWPQTGELRGAIAAAAADAFLEYEREGLVWRKGATAMPIGSNLRLAQLLGDSSGVVGVEKSAEGERVIRVDATGTRFPLTDWYPAIDSIALDPKAKEVAFSAKRDSFDVALVSVAGGAVNWVGPESTDEFGVTWAPRGNKITYVVKQYGGTTFRTVHVPTGYQVGADFPEVHAESVAWEPQAERFAVIASSPLAAPHVQTIRYAGEERKTIVAPSLTREGMIEPLVVGGVAAVQVTPPIRYGRKYALVVVKTASPLAWNEVAAEALAEGKAGVLLVAATAELNARFWQEAADLPWVSERPLFIAGSGSTDVIPSNAQRLSSREASAVSELRAGLGRP